MIRFRKDNNLKIVAVLIAVAFLFTSTVYGIDLPRKSHLRIPLVVNTQEGRRRAQQALLYQLREIIGRVYQAEDEEHELEFYGAKRQAVVRPNGSILVGEDFYERYYSDNLEERGEAIQIIIHEMSEAMLQVIKAEDSDRYLTIKKIAWMNLMNYILRQIELIVIIPGK